jgi:CheY-like chemotaxis protein
MVRQPVKILVAEDDEPNRLILSTILKKQNYEVILAKNGQEAVDLFAETEPDLVLMDIKMPVLDGYEATQQIKAMSGEIFVPVIFLTATTDKEGLVKCIDSGGDDFLTKPYNPVLLQARINALLRIRELYTTVHDQRDELAHHQKRLDRERQLAKRLFANIAKTGSLDRPNINYLLSPLSLFSGDLLLVASKPSGGLHIMLGDFTGHGLAAATGALPVSSIFYGMTAKGYSIAEIVLEINTKLKTILPTDMFLAACLADINPVMRTISVWNGGIPAACIYSSKEKRIIHQVPSRHLPLGVVGGKIFSRRVDVIEVTQGDRLYIYSDGVTEAQNPHGEMFSEDRLMTLFERNQEPDRLFGEIQINLANFQAGREQQDDVTLVEVLYDQETLEAVVNMEDETRGQDAMPASGWNFDLTLSSDLIRHFDPLPLLVQSLKDMQGFRGRRQFLYTIFSELYSNALDHGLLGLDSKLKRTVEGFVAYYKQREERLASLSQGEIMINIAHRPYEGGGEMVVKVVDTGDGFDYNAYLTPLEKNLGHSGRGIQLLRSMCHKVTYYGQGNEVEVIYRW